MSLPYITNSLPGTGGVLRAKPEHFVVEELPLYPVSGQGQHLFVNVTKVGLTTKELQQTLARAFHVQERDVGFAGMKDKQARTTQTLSVTVQHADDAQLAQGIQAFTDSLPVTVNWYARHENKLRPGHLLGNRFTITITDPAPGINRDAGADPVPEAESALARAQAIATAIRRQGVPNYFGPQRFGHDGANVERGLAVLQKRHYVKDRWLRRFLVSAYQSHLCNCYLARRVERKLFARLLPGDVAKKYDTGGMFDVIDVDAEQARYDAQEISFTAPIFGAKMRNAQGESAALEAEILAEAEVEPDAFRRAKADGTRRLGRLLVNDLTVQTVTVDAAPALMVEFTLPKGAFATTVLRELMKIDLAHVPEDEA